MDKQSIVYPYNEILCSHKNDWSTDICYNVNKSQKHAKCKKPDIKYHTLYG